MSDQKTEIKKLWQIIISGNSSVLELRALSPLGITPKMKPVTKQFRAADHADVDTCRQAFESEALRLNANGYNIYIVMNPIRADFTGYAVGDADIAYRDLLLIDIDRAMKLVAPATDADVEEARLMANEIKEYLSERGFADPLRVMSGNGHHLYYVLKDVPNTTETEQAVQQLLKNLAKKFNNTKVNVDTTVFNASRITKVPGTIMRKGIETDDRTYRMAVVYEE